MNEPMHRFKHTKPTKEETDKKLIATAAGPVLSCTSKGNNKLVPAENGGAPVESGCGALTLKQVAFFSRMVPRTQKGYNVIIDLQSYRHGVRGVVERREG